MSCFQVQKRWPPVLAALTTGLLLVACGGDGGSDSASSTTPGTTVTPGTPTAVATLSGKVFAAEVSNAAVALYAADAQGRPTGAALASTTTDRTGNYTLNLTSLPAGAVVVVATGGTYTSEADGSTQTLGTLSALLPAVASGSNTAQLNPVTHTIAGATSNLLAMGGTTLPAALATATSSVKTLFGLQSLSAEPSTVVADPTATAGNGWLIAALAGTLEQLRANAALKPADLYDALREDVADGKLDGLKNGATISVGSITTLQASLFTTQWSGAANAFGTSHPSLAGATASISGALQTAAQAAGVAIGSSGSIAPLQTQAGGTQLYFAARTDGLVKLDMTDPANPVAAKVTAINDAVMLKAGKGFYTSLDGIVINPTPINTSTGAKVFALLYSYRSKLVVAVNLTDGVVADSATLAIASTTSFSGASASIAGGIADGKRGLIWLATADGLMGVNPSNLQAAPVKIAQPALTQVIENIGGDPAKDIVYSPDYDNGTLVVYNLAEAKAYVMDRSAWGTLTGNWAAGEIDGVALDSLYNVAVLTPEGGNQIGLLTYSTPTGATAAVGTLPTSEKFKRYVFNTGTSSFAGSAIDAVTHTALFVGEGSRLGVGVLDDPGSASWQGFSKFVRAGTSTYSFSPHDPHTVGAFNVLGKPYGFVLQGFSNYKVAVFDLNAWLAAPATGGVLTSDPMTNTAITKLLSY